MRTLICNVLKVTTKKELLGLVNSRITSRQLYKDTLPNNPKTLLVCKNSRSFSIEEESSNLDDPDHEVQITQLIF